MRIPTEIPPTLGRLRGLWWWWEWLDEFGLPHEPHGPFASRADALADIEAHDST